jgi:hypothetical protein
MTRDDIIRLAREAGFNVKHLYGEDEVCEQEYEYWRENPDIGQDVITHTVERFAALVAAAERERLDLNAIHTCHAECQNPFCVRVREAVEHEREACALVAESYEPTCDSCPSGVANAIRGRS